MADIKGTTRAQTIFLRSLAQNPAGPPPDQWPTPAILRRWLRRPAFKKALDSLRETLAFRTDLHLAYAATSAAQDLHHPTDPASDPKTQLETHKQHISLLRLHHLRQRFAAKPDPQPPTPDQVITQERLFFRRLDPNAKVGEALSFFERRTPKQLPR